MNDPSRDPQTDALLRAELYQACTALWTATLSLMTAFMHTHAPAHRYLIARRIARNLGTLQHEDCFTAECRAKFARLSQRWAERADQLTLAGEARPGAGTDLPRSQVPGY